MFRYEGNCWFVVIWYLTVSLSLLYFLSLFSLSMSIEIRRRPSFLEESSSCWVLASTFFLCITLPVGEVLFVIFRESFASFPFFILFKRFMNSTMVHKIYLEAKMKIMLFKHRTMLETFIYFTTCSMINDLLLLPFRSTRLIF